MRPTQEQLEKINKFTLEKQFTVYDIEVFKVLLVNDKPTAYSSIIKEDLRNKFATDIDAGKVGLLLYHNDMSLNTGRFFDYELAANALYGWVYIPKNVEFETIDSNSLIDNIKTGVFRSVSVGFTTSIEDYTCSICGEKYYVGECPHLAGMEYDEGTCYVYISNTKGEGRLLEVSVVPAGAVEEAEFVPVAMSDETTVEYPVTFNAKSAGFCYNGKCDGVSNSKKFLMKKLFKEQKIELTLDKEEKMADNLTEKYAEVLAENKVLQTKLSAIEAKLAEHEAKLEEAEKKVNEYKASYESVMDENEKLSKVNGELEESFSAMVELVKEYGVKALGQEFKAEEFDKLTAKEKAEKFSEYVTTFVETFEPGKKVTGEEVAEKVNVSAYKF